MVGYLKMIMLTKAKSKLTPLMVGYLKMMMPRRVPSQL